jgi:hypothetical protein
MLSKETHISAINQLDMPQLIFNKKKEDVAAVTQTKIMLHIVLLLICLLDFILYISHDMYAMTCQP